MAKVQGFYRLRAPLYNKAATIAGGAILYEFTNANRDADVGSAFRCDLNFIQQDSLSTDNYNDTRRFLKNNKLMIKRARVVTPGAPGLQPSPGILAAYFIMPTYATNENGVETFGKGVEIKIPFFNKWADVNLWFENFDIDSADGTYKFYTPSARWGLHVDDYNLQAAYEGQPLYAFLEIEVDTAGLLSGSNKLV